MLACEAGNLLSSLEATPLDPVMNAVYADYLEERGDTLAPVYRARANYLGGDNAEWQATPKQVRTEAYRSIMAHILEPGSANWLEQLEAANGRRRVRTLSESDIALTAIAAYWDASGHNFEYDAGETVANAYGYRSFRTVAVAAKRTDGKVRVRIVEASASKGSSVSTRATRLARNAKPEQFRAWADRK